MGVGDCGGGGSIAVASRWSGGGGAVEVVLSSPTLFVGAVADGAATPKLWRRLDDANVTSLLLAPPLGRACGGWRRQPRQFSSPPLAAATILLLDALRVVVTPPPTLELSATCEVPQGGCCWGRRCWSGGITNGGGSVRRVVTGNSDEVTMVSSTPALLLVVIVVLLLRHSPSVNYKENDGNFRVFSSSVFIIVFVYFYFACILDRCKLFFSSQHHSE